MADARDRAEWKRQAHMMALLANLNRGEGQRAYTADEFNLPAQKNRKAVRRGSIGELKAFLPEHKRNKTGGPDGGDERSN